VAGQPLIHRPVEGIALGRMPPCQLHRKRERQLRRELGQPLRLRACLLVAQPMRGRRAARWSPSR
jgi:hypothetical protein